MKKTSLARAIAGVYALACAGSAGAQQEDAVTVTGSPLGSGLFELVTPAERVDARSLVLRRRSTLGETLEGLPGLGNSSFGPAAGRPVIRGLDGDRIRILQNGTGTLDASSLSFDHAVPHDPLAAERIEVVRGPAAVLYGGNAVGGVVNVIDNRIPQAPLQGVTGRFEGRYGGADREESLGGVLEAGNGSLAIHGDGFTRRSGDLRTPLGRLANSDARADGGALGSSMTWGTGYLGISHGAYRSNYGSVIEPSVRIDMKSDRTDLAGEAKDLSAFVSALRFKLGTTDYGHREIDSTAGTVNTTFRNRGHDGRLELVHGKLGPLRGAAGATFTEFDFSALGAEAYVPETRTRMRGLFLYEELALSRWKLSAGLRTERARVSSPALARDFAPSSGALGAVYAVTREVALAANASRTERAPAHNELFAGGPHAATGAYEVGDPALAKERSRSIDVALRWRRGQHSASIGVFRTRFDNYIALLAGPNGTRGADGEIAPAEDPGNPGFTLAGEEILPELVYRAVPAELRGFEAQGRFRIAERAGAVDLVLRGDYVRAHDRSSGRPLPRIAPFRFTAGLEYERGRLGAGVELQHAARQDRVATGEQATEAHTLVNMNLMYRLSEQPLSAHAFVRVTNLFDRLARNHVSFVKDRAPLAGRGILLGLRGSF